MSNHRIGAQIRELRENRGISRSKLAALSGVPAMAILQCENGGEITLSRLETIITALNAGLQITDHMPPPPRYKSIGEVMQNAWNPGETIPQGTNPTGKPDYSQPEHTKGPRNYEFWDSHEGTSLVWSNPDASDDVMITRALLSPYFHLLLDITAEFGPDRIKQLWQNTQKAVLARGYPEEIREVEQARPTVERFMRHLDSTLKKLENRSA